MKRYIVFVLPGYPHSPLGGWHDVLGETKHGDRIQGLEIPMSFDTVEEALAAEVPVKRKMFREMGCPDANLHVVDLETGETVGIYGREYEAYMTHLHNM